MVVVYVALGWLVERRTQDPKSKLRAFFAVLCSPVTGVVRRFLPPETGRERLLAVSTGAAVAVWVALIALDEVLVRLLAGSS